MTRIRKSASGEGKIVRYTLAEIEEMIARGETHTNWERVGNMTDAEIEAAIASDPDERDMPEPDWSKARVYQPGELLLQGEHDAD